MSIKTLMSVADAAGYAMAAPDDLPPVEFLEKAMPKMPADALRDGIGKALTVANRSARTPRSWLPGNWGGRLPA